ncbi:MAG TPA: metalloregulator ArsR/SmtB family transcription factor [Steroidobacteraceae bacterium]|nr:metalloregulator ArsR/SmtB family transcription factor [Steroidobacteraceae bacterium]
MAESTLDEMFAALADPARRGVVDLLRKKPRRAGELANALSISAPRMSQHLRVLRKTGLIEDDDVEGDARVRLYRLRQQPFSAIRGWLDEVEEFWASELAAFKAHAERGKGRR